MKFLEVVIHRWRGFVNSAKADIKEAQVKNLH